MEDSKENQPGWFGTTQWTQVLAARDGGDDGKAQRALENLCRLYWFPLYGYVRKKGYQQSDAEDLTQGFFAQILEKNSLSSVAREKGKFRTFLLTCLNNYLHDEHDKKSAKKRGGDRQILSLDWEDAETKFKLDPPDDRTPEHYFEKKWALEILKRALARLREDYEESGRGELFRQLKPYLTGNSEPGQLGDIAAALQMKENALRAAVSRLRKRYRDMLKREICDTVANADDADDEYQHVCQVLTGQ